MQHRIFLTLRDGGVFPFTEAFVSRRHAEAGIVAIEERGGLNTLDADGKPAGTLPLRSIARFDICPVGTDGCAMPGSFKNSQ